MPGFVFDLELIFTGTPLAQVVQHGSWRLDLACWRRSRCYPGC